MGDSSSRKQGQKGFPRKPRSSPVTMELKQFKNSIQPTTFGGEQKSVLCFSYFWFSHQNAFVFGPEASLASAMLGEEPSSYGNTKPGGPLVPQKICVLKQKQAELFTESRILDSLRFGREGLPAASSSLYLPPFSQLCPRIEVKFGKY